MLNKKLAEELNKQINIELQAAYLYFSMSIWFDFKSLDGFAHWMELQAQEEVAHGTKIYNYLSDLDFKVTLLPIEKPEAEFKSPQDAFQMALKNEKDLMEHLNALSKLAMEKGDNTTYTFLEWFLTEQVEEISLCSTMLDKLKLIGDNGYGILMLNSEMAARTSSAEQG